MVWQASFELRDVLELHAEAEDLGAEGGAAIGWLAHA